MTRLFGALVVLALVAATQTGMAQTRPAAAGSGAKPAAQPAARPSPGAGPMLVIETVKGAIEIETYPADAPKSVEHIVALVKRNFYNGQRVHRVEPGFIIQFGDPQTRDMTKKAAWGTGGSGVPVKVSEASRKRTHVVGAVALAHPGDPRAADSQLYITMAPAPRLDGKFTVIGKVISGMEIVNALRVNDVIRRVTVK